MARLLFLLTLGLVAGCATPPTSMPPLQPVAHVDLPRYMGDWFVIAHIPYFAEKGKVGTIERYALRPDGKIANTFLFHKKTLDAPQQQWNAVGTISDPATNAEWRVQFFWPIKLAYVVIDLDPDYRWAVVGHPSRHYFWILARERALDDTNYKAILQRAAAQGYEPTRVVKVLQK